MLGCKSAYTPMGPKIKVGSKIDSVPINKELPHLVGELIYLSYIKPNISFTVNLVNQLMNNPIEELMEAV